MSDKKLNVANTRWSNRASMVNSSEVLHQGDMSFRPTTTDVYQMNVVNSG